MTGTKFLLGLLAGYKLVAKKRFVLDLNIGLGTAIQSTNQYDNSAVKEWINRGFIFKIAIGYRFKGKDKIKQPD